MPDRGHKCPREQQSRYIMQWFRDVCSTKLLQTTNKLSGTEMVVYNRLMNPCIGTSQRQDTYVHVHVFEEFCSGGDEGYVYWVNSPYRLYVDEGQHGHMLQSDQIAGNVPQQCTYVCDLAIKSDKIIYIRNYGSLVVL